jgi:hypothetical protein
MMSEKDARFNSNSYLKADILTSAVINHLLRKNAVWLNAGQREMKCQS